MNYVELSAHLRLACYAAIALFMIFRSAYGWHRRQIGLSLIDGLLGLFMLSSFHYVLTRSQALAVYFTTPILFILTMIVVYHTFIWMKGRRAE